MLALACRWLMWIAVRLVPPSARVEWTGEHLGGLWQWTLEAAARGTPDSRFALGEHAKRAFRAACRARFRREQFDSPVFILGSGVALVAILAVVSLGFPVIRHFARGLSYRDPARVVVLAQGTPYFGIRMGFRDREAAVFRDRARTLEGVATYMWSNTVFHSARVHRENIGREIVAAEVGPQFFDVLGVGPSLGQTLDGPETFLASYDFWKSELRGDPRALGQTYDIGGHPLRLRGVMPRSFSFLSTPIAVWIAAGPETPVPANRWWLALRGAIARLRPGVTQAAAEQELHQLLVKVSLARRNFLIRATPIADLVYRPAWSYGFDFILSASAVVLWALFNVFRDRRRGASWVVTRRYWSFFAAKTLLPLLALALFVLEFGGITRLGVTGGVRPASGPFGAWFCDSVIVLILIWAWRDQPGRCRVCLHRMRLPTRIGVPGQMLLETAGEEVMCPRGHGSVYTSESVLGSDMSNRWMGLS